MKHLFHFENLDRWGSNWWLGAKMCFFYPKIRILGRKVNFLYGNCNFFQEGISQVCRGYNFPIWITPKKISVSELCVIFRGSPLFLAVPGHSPITIIITFNFGPFSTKLGGTVRVIKKMTQNDNGPGPGWNYRETAVFTFGRKVFFGQKWVLTQKITQNFLRDWYLFGKRQLFSLNNFFRSWPEHG